MERMFLKKSAVAGSHCEVRIYPDNLQRTNDLHHDFLKGNEELGVVFPIH
jgi:hypothetical protein